jgi:hypothetical protein
MSCDESARGQLIFSVTTTSAIMPAPSATIAIASVMMGKKFSRLWV